MTLKDLLSLLEDTLVNRPEVADFEVIVETGDGAVTLESKFFRIDGGDVVIDLTA